MSRRAAVLSWPGLPWAGTLARLVLAGVFVVAGGIKVADPAGSVRAVQAYDLLPAGLARLVGYGLPFFEIALGLLLLLGLATRLAAAGGAVLLVVFVGGVASAWARGLSIDCGCFGGGGTVAPGETRYLQEILRDLALLLVAAWLVWRPASRLSLDPQPQPAGPDDPDDPDHEEKREQHEGSAQR